MIRSIPTTFVPRKVHDPGGFGYLLRQSKGLPPLELPRDVAGYQMYIDGSSRNVTWKEIHERRAERQRERLRQIRYSPAAWPQPAMLWVFFNSTWFYYGWYAYVRTSKQEDIGGGYKGNVSGKRAENLMRRIPLGVLPDERHFSEWCEAFAKTYPRRRPKHDPRPAGVLIGWTDGSEFFLSREEAAGKEGDAG